MEDMERIQPDHNCVMDAVVFMTVKFIPCEEAAADLNTGKSERD